MPNHVTNTIVAPQEVLDSMVGDKDEDGEFRQFDFDKIIPMPKGLHVTAEGRATTLAELITGQIPVEAPGDPTGSPDIQTMLKGMKLGNALQMLQRGGVTQFEKDEDFENFIQMLRNHRECGHITWYEWAIEHWGTKWNAYDFKEIEGGMQFDTAWSPPHPVIEALAKKFPLARIEHRWADEDIGANCGCRIYKGEEFNEAEVKDPVDFALSLHEDYRGDYQQNPTTGMWEYAEEE